MFRKFCVIGAALCVLLARPAVLPAQPVPASRPAVPAVATLKQEFDAAWSRQPEAQALASRRDSARARLDFSQGLIAAPMALELSARSDRLNRNHGSREYDFGLSLPLWLPQERQRFGALAQADLQGLDSRAASMRLRVAEVVRERYWLAQRARVDVDVARTRLDNARALAADVARRVQAGDLARADQHQADGAVALARGLVAETTGALIVANQQLRALTGIDSHPDAPVALSSEPVPANVAQTATLPVEHPAVQELADRAMFARRAEELARVQTRANPEMIVGTTVERDALGSSYQQTLNIGIRIPFGSEALNRSRVTAARAETIELDSLLMLERDRLQSVLEAARKRLISVREQLDAAQERSRLAQELRGFQDKSFRMGQSDLPTRLRIELEAAEAQRAQARMQIDLAAAVSALRQALGWLPE